MATATRVTVNLTKKSTAALDQTARDTHDTHTDVINRAIQVYAHLEAAKAKGIRPHLEVEPDKYVPFEYA